MDKQSELGKPRLHLKNQQRLPYSFKQVEKVLYVAKKCEANAKTVLYNKRFGREIYNKIYALTFNVLKKGHVLSAIMDKTQLLKKEPSMRKELAEIMIHEMIFGKGLPGNSRPVKIMKKYQKDVEEAYNQLETKGKISNVDVSLPIYARVNTLVITLTEVLENLQDSGFEQICYEDCISETEYFELVKNMQMKSFLIDYHFKDILVFHHAEKIPKWSLYRNGSVLLQDKSSCIPAYVLAPEPYSITLDACAAPGMKTLHLAALMENKGILYAFDKEKERFNILNEILNSGHVEICRTFCKDFNSVDVNDNKFSSVKYILLDPSCSGSGMVKRIDSLTDTKESKNNFRIQKLAGFQIILLKHALRFPSVERVVYSTCSINETENEYVVHEVLNQFRDQFKLVHILPNWPIRGSKYFEFGSLCVRANPEQSLTNGFFVAMFERISYTNDQISFLPKKHKLTNDKESDRECGYGNTNFDDIQVDEETALEHSLKKNKKHKKKKLSDDKESDDECGYRETDFNNIQVKEKKLSDEIIVKHSLKKTKKHKKKKSSRERESNNECRYNNTNFNNTQAKEENLGEETSIEHSLKKGKKHMKKKSSNDKESDNECGYSNIEFNNILVEETATEHSLRKSKKHKKKKSLNDKESGSDTEFNNIQVEEEHFGVETSVEHSLMKAKKHKKKKSSKDKECEYSNTNFSNIQVEEENLGEETSIEHSLKKAKKHKKKKSSNDKESGNECGYSNIEFNNIQVEEENLGEEISLEHSHKKAKKHMKKSRDKESDNKSGYNTDFNNIQFEEENALEQSLKKAKKHKKKSSKDKKNRQNNTDFNNISVEENYLGEETFSRYFLNKAKKHKKKESSNDRKI